MKNKKASGEKIIIIILAVVVIALLVFFLRSVFFPILKMELDNDFDGAKEILTSKGILGGITVSLIEALQMVVIFIPAEFIQISSGMSYPWYVALILCDFGVCLGASAIYFLVKVFRFDGDVFHESEKIAKYDRGRGERNVMLLMYILFITPIIPFGAICYFASNKKISYGRYILTCATGVIPSILTSNIMGFGIRQFILNELPIWALVLIIIAGALLLLCLIFVVVKNFYFKQEKGTPNSPYTDLLQTITKTILGKKVKVTVEAEKIKDLKAPYLTLCNHSSFYDYYFVGALFEKRFPAFVVNDHYMRLPILGNILKDCGSIPKKLFSPDVNTIKGIMKTIKNGYSVAMFPEGRLSADGRLSPINKSIVPLIRKLGVPLSLAHIDGAYLVKPKWRKKIMPTEVKVSVKEVLFPKDVEILSDDELYEKIRFCLGGEETESERKFKYKNKAVGLDGLLYACPNCGKKFSTIATGDTLRCKECGKELTFGDDYTFSDEKFKSIADCYKSIEDFERKDLDGVLIEISVAVKIFRKKSGKYDKDRGVFRLDGEKVSYSSKLKDYAFSLPVSSLEAIAFSVGEEFEFYYDDRLHYFYPQGDRRICSRIALIYDLLKERELWEKTKRD